MVVVVDLRITLKIVYTPGFQFHPNTDNQGFAETLQIRPVRSAALACPPAHGQNPHHGCDSGTG